MAAFCVDGNRLDLETHSTQNGVAMSRAGLSLISDSGDPLIQIFVHGFLNGRNDHFNDLYDQILAARPAGRVYLFHWPSGSMGLLSVPSFIAKQQLAESYGASFRKHVAKVSGARSLPMNLIGHSLGARLIHWALAHYEWKSYKLQNVVMMGSAAGHDDGDWADCAAEVSGLLVNAWSNSDAILPLKRFDPPAGLGPLPVRHPRIRNFNTRLGHLDYWDNLEWVMHRALGSEFAQFEASKDAVCPFCGEENELEPGRYYCDYRRGGCGMYYEVGDDGVSRPVENHIRCATRGCGWIGVVDHWGYQFTCDECDQMIWEPGMRIPPGRQHTDA